MVEMEWGWHACLTGEWLELEEKGQRMVEHELRHSDWILKKSMVVHCVSLWNEDASLLSLLLSLE